MYIHKCLTKEFDSQKLVCAIKIKFLKVFLYSHRVIITVHTVHSHEMQYHNYSPSSSMIVTVVVLPPGTGLTSGPGGMTTMNVSSSSMMGSSMMSISTQARVDPAVKVS